MLSYDDNNLVGTPVIISDDMLYSSWRILSSYIGLLGGGFCPGGFCPVTE